NMHRATFGAVAIDDIDTRVIAVAFHDRAHRDVGERAGTSGRRIHLHLGHQPARQRELRRIDTDLDGKQAALRVGGVGALRHRALKGAARIGVHVDPGRIPQFELYDFPVREPYAHHVAALLSADDEHWLTGGHLLAFL